MATIRSFIARALSGGTHTRQKQVVTAKTIGRIYDDIVALVKVIPEISHAYIFGTLVEEIRAVREDGKGQWWKVPYKGTLVTVAVWSGRAWVLDIQSDVSAWTYKGTPDQLLSHLQAHYPSISGLPIEWRVMASYDDYLLGCLAGAYCGCRKEDFWGEDPFYAAVKNRFDGHRAAQLRDGVEKHSLRYVD